MKRLVAAAAVVGVLFIDIILSTAAQCLPSICTVPSEPYTGAGRLASDQYTVPLFSLVLRGTVDALRKQHVRHRWPTRYATLPAFQDTLSSLGISWFWHTTASSLCEMNILTKFEVDWLSCLFGILVHLPGIHYDLWPFNYASSRCLVLHGATLPLISLKATSSAAHCIVCLACNDWWPWYLTFWARNVHTSYTSYTHNQCAKWAFTALSSLLLGRGRNLRRGRLLWMIAS